ncbi:MAG: hypothetical protein HPY53_01720 [Brevinematales bacterium]|nr:hypothetical protein [Brevinematales bacterium]
MGVHVNLKVRGSLNTELPVERTIELEKCLTETSADLNLAGLSEQDKNDLFDNLRITALSREDNEPVNYDGDFQDAKMMVSEANEKLKTALNTALDALLSTLIERKIQCIKVSGVHFYTTDTTEELNANYLIVQDFDSPNPYLEIYGDAESDYNYEQDGIKPQYLELNELSDLILQIDTDKLDPVSMKDFETWLYGQDDEDDEE